MIDKRKVDRQAAPALPEQLLSPILLALRAPRTEMRDMASIPRSRRRAVSSKITTEQVGHQGSPRSDGRHAAARNRFIGLLNFFGKSGETISTRTHSQIANVASLFWASACWIFWCQCGHGNMGSAYVSASDQKLRRQLCVWAITAQVAVLAQTTK